MDQLVAEGVPDFKLFTAYPGVFLSPDDHIFRAMQRTRENGGLIMMHAENGPVIDILAADLVAAGTTDPIGHGLARHPILEGEATNRVIRLAEVAGVPVYIVHLSARDALEAVTAARDRGAMAFAETCPQYLFLRSRPGQRLSGAKFVCSPRSAKDHQETSGGASSRRPAARGDRPCPSTSTARRSRAGRLPKIPKGLPRSRTGEPPPRGACRGGSRGALGRDVSTAPPGCSDVPRRGRSPPAPTRHVVYDPNRRHVISAAPTTWTSTLIFGREIQGAADVVMSRGTVTSGRGLGRAAGHGRSCAATLRFRAPRRIAPGRRRDSPQGVAAGTPVRGARRSWPAGGPRAAPPTRGRSLSALSGPKRRAQPGGGDQAAAEGPHPMPTA